MRLEVTSVSKKERPLGTSPAAVFVLTNEDIRRSGLTSVPELLRLVPGLHVARIDGSKWAVTRARLQRPLRQQAAGAGRRPHRLLAALLGRVLGRGRRAARGHRAHRSDPRPGRHHVGRQRRQRRHQRHHQAGRRSTPGRQRRRSPPAPRIAWPPASATAASFGDGVSWRAWGKAFDRGPLARADGSRPTTAGGWRAAASAPTTAPTETDELTLQGDLHAGREDQTSAALLYAALPAALRRARRRQRPQRRGALDAHALAAVGDQPAGVRRPHAAGSESLLDHTRTTLDVDFQHRQALGARHDLVWGLGYRRGHSHAHQQRRWSTSPTRDRREWLASAFAEDEIQLVPERLTPDAGHEGRAQRLQRRRAAAERPRDVGGLGARLDLDGGHARRPHAVAARERRQRRTSRRRPGRRACRWSLTVSARGTPAIESLWATEVGYRRHWSTVSVDVSAFRNHYGSLFSLKPGAPELVPAADAVRPRRPT